VAGDGLLIRIRSTSIGVLGLVAAVGLGLTAYVSNQGWPEVFSGPLPQQPRSELIHNDPIVGPRLDAAAASPAQRRPEGPIGSRTARSGAVESPGSRLASSHQVSVPAEGHPPVGGGSAPAGEPAASQPSPPRGAPTSEAPGSPPASTPQQAKEGSPKPVATGAKGDEAPGHSGNAPGQSDKQHGHADDPHGHSSYPKGSSAPAKHGEPASVAPTSGHAHGNEPTYAPSTGKGHAYESPPAESPSAPTSHGKQGRGGH